MRTLPEKTPPHLASPIDTLSIGPRLQLEMKNWRDEKEARDATETPRHMMLERGAHSNWAKKVGVIAEVDRGPLTFSGNGC